MYDTLTKANRNIMTPTNMRAVSQGRPDNRRAITMASTTAADVHNLIRNAKKEKDRSTVDTA
jgi:hypothetical protein